MFEIDIFCRIAPIHVCHWFLKQKARAASKNCQDIIFSWNWSNQIQFSMLEIGIFVHIAPHITLFSFETHQTKLNFHFENLYFMQDGLHLFVLIIQNFLDKGVCNAEHVSLYHAFSIFFFWNWSNQIAFPYLKIIFVQIAAHVGPPPPEKVCVDKIQRPPRWQVCVDEIRRGL